MGQHRSYGVKIGNADLTQTLRDGATSGAHRLRPSGKRRGRKVITAAAVMGAVAGISYVAQITTPDNHTDTAATKHGTSAKGGPKFVPPPPEASTQPVDQAPAKAPVATALQAVTQQAKLALHNTAAKAAEERAAQESARQQALREAAQRRAAEKRAEAARQAEADRQAAATKQAQSTTQTPTATPTPTPAPATSTPPPTSTQPSAPAPPPPPSAAPTTPAPAPVGTFVKPAQGVFTSGFGWRAGEFHYGVDIANKIGTPILSVTDGVVVEAGPASGFGQWIRVQHPDGTITVYGHIETMLVTAGQHVGAGQQIATMGARGNATGPHLHLEVWLPGGMKINPQPWLLERGIRL